VFEATVVLDELEESKVLELLVVFEATVVLDELEKLDELAKLVPPPPIELLAIAVLGLIAKTCCVCCEALEN